MVSYTDATIVLTTHPAPPPLPCHASGYAHIRLFFNAYVIWGLVWGRGRVLWLAACQPGPGWGATLCLPTALGGISPTGGGILS